MTVHFYKHETVERIQPAADWGTSFRRWLVKLVSPRFGHCAISLDGERYEVVYEGFVSGARMVAGYFLPRRFENCASFVGRYVYCPGARTPDELFRLLTEVKGIRPEEAVQ